MQIGRKPLVAMVSGVLLSLVSAAVQAEPRPYLESPTVAFRPLTDGDVRPLNPKVRYVGAYELVATGTSGLVGLSDIQVFPTADGVQAEAVSDFGAVARFTLKADGKGGYLDSPLEIDPLRDADGKTFDNKSLADSEDLAYDPATGRRFVSFEGVQRVMAYSDWRGPGETLPLSGLALFPSNFGMEGLTYLPDAKAGDALLIGVEAGGFWRCELASDACAPVTGPAAPGFLYMLTSLAVVDYADPVRRHEILALYRYFDPLTGPRNILRLLKYENRALTVITDLVRPKPYDNYEGVAAQKTGDGYRLYLISDSLKENGRSKLLVYDWTP
ncbi:hypothetical protein AEAC466_04125 [Asticcacaulis sp. AC466]|uniref:esterase-like activity of phytase family protein n=1 Tax=Asticcacaulis sp. AC466 TaxID=1282362 RepID=UPI0003C41288|nr:esterase-like activity of phytase family protein [Asticcacaulis sp. AC466]ESQ86397.1 hypothetical protein AEAC466_04125 [Asticcacaulis sp. AC466]